MPATEPFPWLDPDWRSDDSAERLVRKFFDACESPGKRARTDKLLRRGARSALRGTTRYSVLNVVVSHRLGKLTGLPGRVKKMQLVSAHLLGIAYIRYVFKLEPIASMDIEELIQLSIPVVSHYLADCKPQPGLEIDTCAFSGSTALPRECTLCNDAQARAISSPMKIPAP